MPHPLCHREGLRRGPVAIRVVSFSSQFLSVSLPFPILFPSMREKKYYFVYIMTNPRNTVLYTGVTSDLKRRIFEHKNKLLSGFIAKYNVTKLVYYEVYEDPENAILREKQIKAGSRAKKIRLIHSLNPEWRDLSSDL